MKRENIEQRIKNFFADLEEPDRTHYINITINYFTTLRKEFHKCISDTHVIQYAIQMTIRHHKL